MIDGCSGSGKVSVILDFRSDEDGKTQRAAYWNRLEDVVLLVSLLGDLCGSDVKVFFEFGVVTLKDVDLSALANRIRSGDTTP